MRSVIGDDEEFQAGIITTSSDVTLLKSKTPWRGETTSMPHSTRRWFKG